jgi:Prokaryotic dksA/traR C4-type zinc finger
MSPDLALLAAKIDAALARIDDGTYGYCEETGEPINLRRLEARPIATLSLEAQERHETRAGLSRRFELPCPPLKRGVAGCRSLRSTSRMQARVSSYRQVWIEHF